MTNVETTPATTADVEIADTIHAKQADKSIALGLVQALRDRLAAGPIAGEALHWQDIAADWE